VTPWVAGIRGAVASSKEDRKNPQEETETCGLAMTTYRTAEPNTPVPVDPYANKAVATALVTILTVLAQLASSDWNISFDQEGITAIGGAVATLVVYVVSNYKRRGV
jgi:hypothetical protein